MIDKASPAPALLALRDAIDARWPGRSKASDGVLGDASHQARPSDHNDGNALDITHDPTRGPDLEVLSDALIHDPRTHYVIWNRRIRNRAFEAGAWRPYTGASPHTAHLHLSVFAEKRDDTGPWRLTAEAPTPEPAQPAASGNRHAQVFFAGLGLLAAVALLVHVARDDRPRPHPAWS